MTTLAAPPAPVAPEVTTYAEYAVWRTVKAAAHEDVLWGDDEAAFPDVPRLELLAWGNAWRATQPRQLIDYGTPVYLPEGP